MIFYCSVEYSTSWKTLKILSSKSVIPLLIHSVAPTTWLSSRTFANSMFHELENVLRKKCFYNLCVSVFSSEAKGFESDSFGNQTVPTSH